MTPFRTLVREAIKSLSLLIGVVFLALWLSNYLNNSRPNLPEVRTGEWQDSEDATKLVLTQIVHEQLQGIRDSNFLAAYLLAASTVQRQFTVQKFEQMILSGYPELASTGFIEIRNVIDNGEQASVELRIAMGAGARARFVYFLMKESGNWKVVGVARQNGSRADK